MQNKLKTAWWIIGAIFVIAFLLVLGHFTSAKPAVTITSPSTLPGIIKGDAPWSAGKCACGDYKRYKLTPRARKIFLRGAPNLHATMDRKLW